MSTLKQFRISPKKFRDKKNKIKPMFDLINPQANVIRAFAYECLSSKHRQTELKKYWTLPLSLDPRRRSRRSMANQLEFWERGSVECAAWEKETPREARKKIRKSPMQRNVNKSFLTQRLLHSSHVTFQKRTAFSHVFIDALTVCRRISVLCFSWSLCSLPVKRGSVSSRNKINFNRKKLRKWKKSVLRTTEQKNF